MESRETSRRRSAALDAAQEGGVGRIVHVSTQNAFGDTGDPVVDETHQRPRPYRYVSDYDETKHAPTSRRTSGRGRRTGADRHAGGVYGPATIPASAGTSSRPRAAPAGITFGDLGMNMAHVGDIATGIHLVGTRGRIGESYVLGGELTTMAELVRRVAAVAASAHRGLPPDLAAAGGGAARPAGGTQRTRLRDVSRRRHVLGTDGRRGGSSATRRATSRRG